MIKNVTICKCPNVVYAKFDTKIESDGKDKGRRVRHLIYPDDEGLGYWHEMRYLSEDALTVKPTRKFDLVISERVFFGKARLVLKRDLCIPETWIAIGETVQRLEKMMAREKMKKYKEKEK